MGALRKDPTKRQGLFAKTQGRNDGLTLKERHVREQDTGRSFGRGSGKAAKPIRSMGRGV